MKVATIVGTRPEIIKLSRVIQEIDKHMDQVLVHTGQNYDYELNQIFFDDLGLRKPDHFLDAAGNTGCETVANVIVKLDALLTDVKPDAVLILGDTNSCMGIYAAKRHKIPIFHMEAGNRCFDQRVPEEVNRKVIDHLSDINLVYTEHARGYLLAEGLPADRIIKTGSPMREVLQHHKHSIDASNVLDRLELQVGGYFLASLHREENVDSEHSLKILLDALIRLHREFGKPVLFPAHPRTQKRIEKFYPDVLSKGTIQFIKPLGFFDYVHLQQNALCVLSDSGTLTEESSILKFPAVMLRAAHERPEGMDEGAVIMSGLSENRIVDAMTMAVAHARDNNAGIHDIADYAADNVSVKMARIILGYTDFVNRVVWHKEI